MQYESTEILVVSTWNKIMIKIMHILKDHIQFDFDNIPYQKINVFRYIIDKDSLKDATTSNM